MATPPPLVDVTPTHEVRTVAPVNEVAVDGGRAATLVGAAQAWEYLLVWSPKGIVVRASLACDTQESNVVLAANRFAHLCFQEGRNIVVTGTLKPLRGRVALQGPGTAQVALSGSDGFIAGSSGRVVWRFDQDRKRKIASYASSVIALSVDRGRILVDRGPAGLDVLSSSGKRLGTIERRHGGGAVLRDGRIATLEGRSLVTSDLLRRVAKTRTVAPGARLEDVAGGFAVYSVETRLHLLRLSDGRDVALRLRGQFGYAHARLSGRSLFYTYNGKSGRLGHAGYIADIGELFR